MIYPYRCECGEEFEVIKFTKEIDRVENCPKCGHNCDSSHRYISRTHFYGADDWNSAEYNPAFGKHLTPKQAKAEAKSRGMIEVGNEDFNKYHKHLDDANQRRRDSKWSKV